MAVSLQGRGEIFVNADVGRAVLRRRWIGFDVFHGRLTWSRSGQVVGVV